MLNFDFFQPFKHGKYLVGVFYITSMDLPRSIRFKPENVILVGAVPPINSGSSLNTFLKPLVKDLQTLWNVGVTIPAARKVVGFLSHSANRGCSKCLKIFPGRFGKKTMVALIGVSGLIEQMKITSINVKHLKLATFKKS